MKTETTHLSVTMVLSSDWGALQRVNQGGWQTWEHGLLFNLDQEEEKLPGLLPCVRG